MSNNTNGSDARVTEAFNLVNEINTLEAKLRGMKDRLRVLVGGPEPKAAAPTAKRNKRVKSARDKGVNITEVVLALVNRQTGLSVPQIMDKLDLRDHEAAVRSALKKANEKSIVSVQGRWYPIGQPQTEKAPTVKSEPSDSAAQFMFDGG